MGFSPKQTLPMGEGRIGVNNVVGFTNESNEHPIRLLPARFLAGFIPTFLLAEEIAQKYGVTPSIRIFFPKHIAHTVNDIPFEKIHTQIDITTKIILAFQKKCFPDLSIHFTQDEPISTSSMNVLGKFASLIQEVADKDILERIRLSARRHGSENGAKNTSLYIAHHPFGWQEVQEESIFKEPLPDIVINTLAPSERRFLLLRRSVRTALAHAKVWETPKEIHDVEMNIAGAHYLLLYPHEPTLHDALSQPSGHILERLKDLKKQTDNDNIRKAKNDFERIMEIIASRTGRSKEEVAATSLGALLEVRL